MTPDSTLSIVVITALGVLAFEVFRSFYLSLPELARQRPTLFRPILGFSPMRLCLRYFCFLVFFVATATAAENSGDETPALPEITNLSADWWNYVATAAMDERPARLSRLLNAIRETITVYGGELENAAGLSEEIASLVETYAALLQTKFDLDTGAPSPNDEYTFTEVLDLHARVQEAALELKLARDLVQRETRNLPQSEKQLSSQKAKYLAMSVAEPGKLGLALQIIADRLRLSIDGEQLRLEKTRLSAREQALASITEILEDSVPRLVIDKDQIEDSTSRAARYRERTQLARREVTSIRSLRAASASKDTAQTNALHAIKVLVAEAISVENETTAVRYELQAAYLMARFDTIEESLHTLRERRVGAELFAKETRLVIDAWREAATRERSLALKSLSTEMTEQRVKVDAISEQRVGLANEVNRLAAQTEAEISRIEFIEKQAAAFLTGETGRFYDLLAHAVDFLQRLWTNTRVWATSSLFEINDTPVTPAGLLRVLVILFVAFWISKAVRHGLERLGRRSAGMNRSSLYILGRIFHYVILITAFLIALSTLGLDFTKLAILVGALGVGIGFGLQAIFSNFISGIIVLFERSLKVGDFVELESGVTGEVREINIRSTLITTNDNIDILVPNSEFVNGRVINWTLRDAHRRVRIPFGVAYGTNKDLVKQAVLEAAGEISYTLQHFPGREPQVWLVEFGDSSLNFELVVWLSPDAVRRPGAVHAAYTWAIETALGKHGIEIPFPQRDLHVRSFFGQRDDAALERLAELKHGSKA